MRSLQDIFNQIQKQRTEQRNIKKMYRDALDASGEYKNLTDKLEELKAKKKQLESAAWEEIGNRDKYEVAKLDIKHDKEMLTDMAINILMKGETVKVIDEDQNEYEPKFSVSFKKTNVVQSRQE